ncbi:MAG: glycosyltransferase family 2 protein [Bacteroidota bacterium]|nr:glycosyltransferase family 2 protein [Bacteroidota bacterium]
MKKIALAILNWNGRTLLETYLPHVIRHSEEADIWLVDNHSDDDSVAWAKANFPEINILELDANHGYAEGYNQALEVIKNDWIGLVNSDIRTSENWLLPILEDIQKNPRCGAIQPKILDDRDPERFEYAGASGGFIDQWGYPFCRGRIFDTLEVDRAQYDEPMEIFWATGACLFVKRSCFMESGRLDADFFAHMEEIDLCWRIQRKGYSIRVVPASVVFHLGGGTLSAQNSKKTYLNFRNNLLLLYKNLDRNRILTLFGRMILDGVSALKFLMDGKANFSIAVLKAHFHFYRMLPTLRQKRREVKELGTLKLPTGWYKGSIVWAFFIRRKKTFSSLPKRSFV